MSAVVTSLINWKGGVGKTTLALHLAAGLAERDYRILLIDLDPQCNLSFLAVGIAEYIRLAYDQKTPTLKNAFDAHFEGREIDAKDVILKEQVSCDPGQIYTRVDMIMSHQELTLLDLQLAREHRPGKNHRQETEYELGKVSVISNLIQQVSNDYDFILIDCPPNINHVTQNAFLASDWYLAPAIPDFLSTVGISLIKRYMDDFNHQFQGMHQYIGRDDYRDTVFLGVVFNMVDEYNGGPKAGHQQIITQVSSSQGNDKVFRSYVTDGDGITAASQANMPVFAFKHLPRAQANGAKQAEYLNRVVDEFLDKVQRGHKDA